MIDKISIKNIKGYGDPAVVFDLNIVPDKVNIIYAPNGTGKSSMAIAFDSLKPKSLDVNEKYKYHKDETLKSELSVRLDGTEYFANKHKNDIYNVLDCTVINCDLAVHTIQNRQGPYTSVSGYLDIADLEIATVPDDIKPKYKITKIRNDFGINGKILHNYINIFENRDFWLSCNGIYSKIQKFFKSNKRGNEFNAIQQKIQGLNGSANSILDHIDNSWFNTLEKEPLYREIIDSFKGIIAPINQAQRYLFFYQLNKFLEDNHDQIIKANKRSKYNNFRSFVDSNLSILDTTWKGVHTEELKDKLIVRFPQADEISNGQRDLLTFFVELLKFNTKIKTGKKYLLIVDEIFDYLDDANTITAQYYLSKFLELNKGCMYLCLLTHLNPYTFKNYIFPDNKVNHIYLIDSKPCATKQMMAFIAFRNGLDKKDDIQKTLYDKLSSNLFHYNTISVDYSNDLKLKNVKYLRSDWGKREKLHQALIDEVNKYLSGQPQYDPYGVAMALRLRIEKLVYDEINSANDKIEFIVTKTTKLKLEFARNIHIDVPDVYNIINAIHNEAEHLKYNSATASYEEKAMVYKLQNNSIRQIISRIFGYESKNLTIDVIG